LNKFFLNSEGFS